MLKFKRLALTLAAIMAGALGAVAVASPASAYPNCSAGRVCTYWDTYYGGAMYYYTGPFWTCINVGYPWNDQISSVANTVSSMRVEFWTDAGCNGSHTIINKGGLGQDAIQDLRVFAMNDAISSLMFIS